MGWLARGTAVSTPIALWVGAGGALALDGSGTTSPRQWVADRPPSATGEVVA